MPEFTWKIPHTPTSRQEAIDDLLKTVADAASKLADLANADGTIGDATSQHIVSTIFAMSLDEIGPEVDALAERHVPIMVELEFTDFDGIVDLSKRHPEVLIAFNDVKSQHYAEGEIKIVGPRHAVIAFIKQGWDVDAAAELQKAGVL